MTATTQHEQNTSEGQEPASARRDIKLASKSDPEIDAGFSEQNHRGSDPLLTGAGLLSSSLSYVIVIVIVKMLRGKQDLVMLTIDKKLPYRYTSCT